MEYSTYKKATQLENAISSKETKLLQIQKMLKSAKLQCEVEGDYHGNMSWVLEYTSENSEFIRQLLEADKILVTKELEELYQEFKEL